MKAFDTFSDAKGLWALFWRMLVFGPILGIFGILALTTVICLTVAPPLVVIMFVTDAKYLWAGLTVALWLIWLRYGGLLRRFVFEGFEHGSL